MKIVQYLSTIRYKRYLLCKRQTQREKKNTIQSLKRGNLFLTVDIVKEKK